MIEYATKPSTTPIEPPESEGYDKPSEEELDNKFYTEKVIRTSGAADDSRYKKGENSVSSSAPTLSQLEVYRRVDRALFGAYLKRLEALLREAVGRRSIETSLTQIIKISE